MGSTPLVYRSWAESRNSDMAESHAATPTTTQRLPLSTLTLQSDGGSPSQRNLRRLVKGKERARDQEDSLVTSPINNRPSAFTRLLEGAKRQHKKLRKSDFIEGEAQESDEDELFGFGGPKKKDDDDESEDDDGNAVVENLFDDTTMDAEQLAEDKVLEKVK